MPDLYSWLDQERRITSAALTVRAQAQALNDLGKFYHPIFFPRQDAPDVRLADMIISNFRPVADRREWNAPGRLLPMKGPGFREIEIIPVESYFTIEEYEMTRLLSQAQGNEALFRATVAPGIPARVDRLVEMNLRRLEVDALRAWALGVITVRNPQGSAADKVVDLQFAGARYPAPTPWTGGAGGTAYAQLFVHMAVAQGLIGAVRGIVLGQTTMDALQTSAPLASATGQVIPLGIGEIERRIREQFGGQFTFNVVEDTVEPFNDGGTDTTPTRLWPANRVAFIPAGTTVGNTFYAPVARAYQMAGANPSAQIDVNGMTVVRDVRNNGKELHVECQVNALAVPDEQRVYVVDAGI